MFDSVIKDTKSSLFILDAANSIFSNVSISNINCTFATSFCVLATTAADTSLLDCQITGVTTNANLMTFRSSTNVLIQNTRIIDIKRASAKNSSLELFNVALYKASIFKIKDSIFESSSFSFLKSSQSSITIDQTYFSNKIKNQASSVSDNSKIQFLRLYATNANISGSFFTENSLNQNIDGGVIYLLSEAKSK